jgi:hypothetical protein
MPVNRHRWLEPVNASPADRSGISPDAFHPQHRNRIILSCPSQLSPRDITTLGSRSSLAVRNCYYRTAIGTVKRYFKLMTTTEKYGAKISKGERRSIPVTVRARASWENLFQKAVEMATYGPGRDFRFWSCRSISATRNCLSETLLFWTNKCQKTKRKVGQNVGDLVNLQKSQAEGNIPCYSSYSTFLLPSFSSWKFVIEFLLRNHRKRPPNWTCYFQSLGTRSSQDGYHDSGDGETNKNNITVKTESITHTAEFFSIRSIPKK